ncbi:MAG: carbon storage regulator [Pirellulales bacterium]|nr:carbon storage regulator [Pirellulales bacterium]
MLVLSRKYQEKIHIGDNITITVLRMKGKAIRLGIEAPSEVPVVRGELAAQASVPSGLSAEKNEETSHELEQPNEETALPGRRLATALESRSLWGTDSSPSMPTQSNGKAPLVKVALTRIPRNMIRATRPAMASEAPNFTPVRASAE